MIAVPMILGRLICSNIQLPLCESWAYRFVAGFFTMLAIWAVMALPFTLFTPKLPFHLLRYVYLAAISIICLSAEIQEIRNGKTFKSILSEVRGRFNASVAEKPGRVYLIVFMAIMAFQIFETVYYAPVGYVNDDLWYYSYINDTVYMDQLYPRVADGSIPAAAKSALVSTAGYKMVVIQWFSFIAFLSDTTKIHTLIMCRTLIPACIIIALYATMQSFGAYAFPGNRSKQRCFLMWSAVIIEILSYSYYLFFLTLYISTYGKQIAGIIGIPFMMLTLYMMIEDSRSETHNTAPHMVLLLAVNTGAVSTGVSTLLSGSLALTFMSVMLFIRHRTYRTAVYIICAWIPFLVYFLTYMSIGGQRTIKLTEQYIIMPR